MTSRKTEIAANPGTPRLATWWWIPSAVVILALALLLIVPAAIEHRVMGLRESLAVGEHARTVVNDFEASFASELLVRNSALRPEEFPPVAGAGQLDADMAELRSALGQIDGTAVAHYDSLSNLLRAWRASPHDGSRASTEQGLKLIAAGETLDEFLTKFVATRRDQTMALARYYVLIPAILAPIAVLAMIVAMWSGRRLQLFARIADAERAEVVRASEARAALLRGVTHDVKNPLGAAAGYAQILEEGIVGPLVPAQTDMVRRIRHLLGVSVQTVTDLLELARADGTLHLEYASTDLATIMTEVVEDHRGMAQEHGLELDASAQPTPIVTDPIRVRQILANIISNAIKYTPRGGRVRARIVHGQLDGQGERVGVAVTDTGPGIPRDLQSKVFEEFFRVRGSGNGADGNGLGLAISRRLARLLGGDVTYTPSDEGGSTFVTWLPAGRS